MFLTMQGIRKSFGAGESRVEVLRVYYWDHPVPGNPPF